MRNKATIIYQMLGAALIISLVVLTRSANVKAEDHYLHDEYVSVDGNEKLPVRTIDCEYHNNEYVSLKDMAEVLRGTSAQFSVEITDSEVIITTGQEPAERTLTGWREEEKAALKCKSVATNRIVINGEERKYYNLRAAYEEGVDCFIRPLNLCMMLNVDMKDNKDGSFSLNTGSIFIVSPKALEQDGFFDELSSVLVGDATTGEILYEHNGDNPYPVASITKLMTYLLTKEAMACGEFTPADYVTISEEAAEISRSGDGSTPMLAGGQITVGELIYGALLPSSNECAYLLGEKVSGNQDDFVALMNERALELGMTTAHFNNANGLPSYSDSEIPSKRQNVMSSKDLFVLCSYILETFPDVKEVTGLRTASLPNLGMDVKNTNALLYNMPEVNGMKTGTTDSAGACLVTSLTINDGSTDHDLVVVLLGGENSRVRFTTSEVLAYYAKNVVLGNLSAEGSATSLENDSKETIEKITASGLVNMIVKKAMSMTE